MYLFLPVVFIPLLLAGLRRWAQNGSLCRDPGNEVFNSKA